MNARHTTLPAVLLSAVLLPALLLLASCAGNRAPDAPAVAPGDQLSMTRGPCFGTCPMYTVTAWGDGRVRFVGERFVEKAGEHTGSVDPAEIAALFAYADSIGFFDMPQNITPANESACGSAWTDMPSAEITMIWADRDQTVTHYHGCPKAPAALTDLEARIDRVLDSQTWIGR